MTPAIQPILMGVVNVTPDSFSDGNQFLDPAAAATQALKLIHDGATIIDLGAEASSFFRPGIAPIPATEQLRRLQPVLAQLHNTTLSIDTRSAEVARILMQTRRPLIINDISAGTHDPAMFPTAAAAGGSMILMHISPTYPENAKEDDPDILSTAITYLHQRIAAAIAAGIPKNHLLIDPGIGFGKTPADNWQLILHAQRLQELGCPIVLGASRKRFLQSIHQQPALAPILHSLAPLAHLAQHDRDVPSAAITLYAASQGVPIHRVHNVALAHAALQLHL